MPPSGSRQSDTGAEPIRVGLVGCGAIGRFRVQALERSPGLQLVAVADLRRDAAEAVAAMAPGVRVVEEPGAMAGERDLHAVIISTPPASHAPLGLPCLYAGKHLLVEKPLASSVEAAEQLVQAAAEAKVTLATGFTLRKTPAAMLAMDIVKRGGIGEIDHVRAFHGHKGGSDFGPAWITDHAATGGGTLMDNGIHMIDAVRWFLGDIESAIGYATNRVWQKPGCEDNGYVLMRGRSGKIGALHSTWSEWRGYGWRCEVYGREGAVRFGYPPMWLVHSWGKPGGKMRRRLHIFPLYQILERVRGWQWGLVDTLRLDQEDWAAAIRSGTEAPASGRDGLEAIRIAKSVDYRDVDGLPERGRDLQQP